SLVTMKSGWLTGLLGAKLSAHSRPGCIVEVTVIVCQPDGSPKVTKRGGSQSGPTADAAGISMKVPSRSDGPTLTVGSVTVGGWWALSQAAIGRTSARAAPAVQQK